MSVATQTTHGSRQRTQLVVAGALLAGVVAAAGLTVELLADRGPAPWVVLLVAVTVVAAGAIAGNSRLVRRESGRLLSIAAQVSAVALVMLLGLVVIVLALGHVPTRDEQSVLLPALAAVGIGALAYPAIRRRITAAARRSAAGSRRTPEQVLATFGDPSLRDAPVEELLLQLAESLRPALGLANVEVWTGDRDGLQRLLSVPHRAGPVTVLGADDVEVLRRAGVAGEAWLRLWLPQLLIGRADAQLRVAPAAYGGDPLGLVVVERLPDAPRFSDRDEQALADVVRRLGVVLHNRQLDSALQASHDDLRRTNDELRASRARLVAAADRERRRIERNIHDGAQQHLVALAVTLGLVKDMLADDPAAARALLDDMTGDVRETIAQVRDLAHGIYPPLLREAGLEGALRAAANRSPLPVSLDAAGLSRHDADVEAAVYFCCLEALQNSAKHAGAATVEVRVYERQGLLVFDVCDDGPGFVVEAPGVGAGAGAGQGFQNMIDRLGAMGGVVTVTSTPGSGTRVHGEVPVTEVG
ncbi:MAG: sensor histidine kinase [Actinomycetes bacterium]